MSIDLNAKDARNLRTLGYRQLEAVLHDIRSWSLTGNELRLSTDDGNSLLLESTGLIPLDGFAYQQ